MTVRGTSPKQCAAVCYGRGWRFLGWQPATAEGAVPAPALTQLDSPSQASVAPSILAAARGAAAPSIPAAAGGAASSLAMTRLDSQAASSQASTSQASVAPSNGQGKTQSSVARRYILGNACEEFLLPSEGFSSTELLFCLGPEAVGMFPNVGTALRSASAHTQPVVSGSRKQQAEDRRIRRMGS